MRGEGFVDGDHQIHRADQIVIRLRQSSAFQHGGKALEQQLGETVDVDFFAHEEISSGAKYMNKTLNSWITGMSIDERIRLVDVLYGLLTAGNIENVFDAGDIQKNIGAIYNAAVHLDPETRSFVLQIIRQLAGFALHNIPHPNVPENLNILPGNKTQN